MLTETTVGRFIDTKYPLIATARLSGMMLDYPKLLEKGIGGLREDIQRQLKKNPKNQFHLAALDCLDIFADSAKTLAQKPKIRAYQRVENGKRNWSIWRRICKSQHRSTGNFSTGDAVDLALCAAGRMH